MGKIVIRKPEDRRITSGRSSTDPGVARAVIGAALYLTVVGLFGLGLGAILRNTAGGIASFAAIMFVLPPLMNVLPSPGPSLRATMVPYEAIGGKYQDVRVRIPDTTKAAWRPVPASAAPVLTVTPLDAAIEPFTISAPASTVVAPV